MPEWINIVLSHEVTLIWKRPVSKTAGATICQRQARAACCAAALPRLPKGALFQLPPATNPERKAAGMLITDFQGQMRTDGCSACLLLIGKEEMQGGVRKSIAPPSLMLQPRREREKERSLVRIY